MKSIFRFMRGELNGFYLNAIRDAVEAVSLGMRTFMAQFALMDMLVWQTVPSDVIQGFGIFSGVMLPYVLSYTNRQALFMTGPFYGPGDVQRSERGLFVRSREIFRFHHTEQDDYPDDINTLADDNERSSVAGNSPIVGYVLNSETDVIREDGTVDPSKVLPYDPVGQDATPFYGNEFLMLGSSDRLPQLPTDSLYLALIRAMQHVRYNGPSMASVLDISSIICPEGYIKIGVLTTDSVPGRYILNYKVVGGDDDPDIFQKTFLFQHVMGEKFPQVLLNEEQEST